MLDKIRKLVDKKINPRLKLHSGGCKVIDCVDGIVTVELTGGCVGCPSSKITLLNGIAPILMAEFPDIKDIMLVS
jgi:Fe/S biogenesis protein NfuA